MSQRESDSRSDDAPFRRGHVVWVEEAAGVEPRPYLVLSATRRHEQDREYVGVPLSITGQEDAVRISPDDWRTGGPAEASFAITWRPRSFPHWAIAQGIGALGTDAVEEVARAAGAYIDP